MKIFGIGSDIINIKRLEKSLKKKGNNFKKKIFSENEINYCDSKVNSYPYYAKRFAAKEALSKALGTGLRKGISLKSIEVFNDKKGKPFIKLKGDTQKYLMKKVKNKKCKIHLTLSDDEPWAQATVIITY
tara:strand:+ start:390 stop:779 length:390 start_codon:yes stop_codon:yes gene_type:complete